MSDDPFGSDSVPALDHAAPSPSTGRPEPSPQHQQPANDSTTAEWELNANDYDRPAVCSAMTITGPAARTVFDAISLLYAMRGKSKISLATTKAARSIVESVVAPLASMSVTSTRFTAAAPTGMPKSMSSNAVASSHALDSLDTPSHSSGQCGAEIEAVMDAAGLRCQSLTISELPKNRLARIVMERAVMEHGAIAQHVLDSLKDDVLARRELLLMHATPPPSLGFRVNWAGSSDAKVRYIHSVAPPGGVHIVAASIDHLMVRLRAEKQRRARGVDRTEGGECFPDAFESWFAEIDAAVSAAFAACPTRTGTVIMLSTEGQSDSGMSTDEMQRLLGRVHDATVMRESQRAAECREARVTQPPPIIALVVLSVEYGSRSMHGAIHGDVGVSEVSVVCSAVNTTDGPLGVRGMDLSHFVKGGFAGSHGVELVRTSSDVIELLDALTLHCSIADTGNAHCIVEGGVIAYDNTLRSSATHGRGLTTTQVAVVDAIETRVQNADESRCATAFRVLRSWGSIIVPPPPVDAPDDEAPVVIAPRALHALVGLLASKYYAAAAASLHSGVSGSATLSATTFTFRDARRWLSPFLGMAVFAARDSEAEDSSSIVSDADIMLVLNLLQSLRLVSTVGSTSDDDDMPDLWIPGASPAAAPRALAHTFAHLAQPGAVQGTNSMHGVRWLSFNTEPSAVLAGLAALFAESSRRGPANHVLAWRDALVLGIDPDPSAESVTIPQRTALTSLSDPRTGVAIRVIAVITVSPSVDAESAAEADFDAAAASQDSTAASMFESIVAALQVLQRDTLPGLEFGECVPCPSCLRRCVPSADGGWVDGHSLVVPESAKEGAASAATDTLVRESMHVFTRTFIDSMTSAGESDTPPTTARGSTVGNASFSFVCPLCTSESNLRTVGRRAARVLFGSSSTSDDHTPPAFIPKQVHGVLDSTRAALKFELRDDALGSLLQFGSSVDSLVWSLVKIEAADRKENLRAAADMAGFDSVDEPAVTREEAEAATDAGPEVRRGATEDEWEVV